MNNFKKLTFLFLMITIIFMAGCVSAVDIGDSNISSEDPFSNVALDECQLESITESDALVGMAESDASDSGSLGEAACEIASGDSDGGAVGDVLGSDSAGVAVASGADEKLGDPTPDIDIRFGYGPTEGIYHESVSPYIELYVFDAPAENFDVKITIDGLEYQYTEVINDYSSWYEVEYTFDPATGVLHFDHLQNRSKGWSTFSFTIATNATRVGDASVTVEWENNTEKKQITKTIPIAMGEADLVLEKRTFPYQIYHPSPVWLPNPNSIKKDSDMLGQFVEYDDALSDVYPFARKVGDTLVWYVWVQNEGPNIAYDINVTDSLPEGVVLDSFTAVTGSFHSYYLDRNFGNQITYDEQTGIFHIPQLLNTQYAYITIVAHATTAGLKTNVAKVSSATPDPNMTNNEGNSTYMVKEEYDVSIYKSAWTDYETMLENADPHGNHIDYAIPKIQKGDTVYWLIFVNNDGISGVGDITVKEVMPEGLEILSVQNVSTGNFDQETNVWTIDGIYPGQVAYLIIETAAVKTGNITNHAVVSTPSEETNLDNNEANATVIVEGDEPLTNETDESKDDNSTDGDNSTDEEDPVEEEITGISHEEETSIDGLTLADEDVGSKAVVSKSVGAATGNPVFMVLLAFLIIAENIFRGKR